MSELLDSRSDVSWVIPEGHESGTVAESWLVAKLSCLSNCSADHWVGSVPARLLDWAWRVLRAVRTDHWAGSVPTNELLWSSSV